MSNRALYEAVRKIEGVSDEEARAAAESFSPSPEAASRADLERAESELRTDLSELRGEFSGLRTDLSELRGEFSELRGEFSELRTDLSELRGEFSELRTDLKDTEARLRTDLVSKKDLEQFEARLRADLASKEDLERFETKLLTEMELFRRDMEVSVTKFQRTIESAISGIEIRCLKWNLGALVALAGIFALVIKYA